MPPGQWTDWWTGETHAGDQTITRAAPLDVIPLYAAAGAPVPMLRETIDTTAVAVDPEVDSFGNDPGRLFVAVSPGPRTTFELYEGTAITQETTESSEGRTISISIESGEVFSQGSVIELYGLGSESPSATVRTDGSEVSRAADREAMHASASAWTWSDARGGTAWVQVPAGAQSLTVTLPGDDG